MDECAFFWCDNKSSEMEPCLCFDSDHQITFPLCTECAAWMNARITCPFHGDN